MPHPTTPRFAEQLTRDWLEAAGRGESSGIHLDSERAMWRYRDWVLDAFLRNERLDRFVVAQLAGDLLLAEPRRVALLHRSERAQQRPVLGQSSAMCA